MCSTAIYKVFYVLCLMEIINILYAKVEMMCVFLYFAVVSLSVARET